MARLNRVAKFRGTSKTEDGNLTCGRCGDKITPGDAYRWWANKLPGQGRGSARRIRCMKDACTPTRTEMTPGRRGQLMSIQDEIGKSLESCADFDDIRAAREDAASQIRELGQEFTDGAENMESGFGHETYQSQELREKGEALEAVAEELEYMEPDSEPDPPDEHGNGSEEYADAIQAFRDQVQEKSDEAEV